MIESVINEATMIANQLEQIRALIYADHAVVVRGDFHPRLVEHANVPSPQLMWRTWARAGVTISGVTPASTGRQLTGTTIDLRRFNVRVRRE